MNPERCPECSSTVLLGEDWKVGEMGFCKRCSVPLVVTEKGVRRPTKEELVSFVGRKR